MMISVCVIIQTSETFLGKTCCISNNPQPFKQRKPEWTSLQILQMDVFTQDKKHFDY